jgi:Flp pilus assembly protein TadD
MSRVNAGSETGRNDPCPCGSGRKYKKCCMGKAAPRQQASGSPKPDPGAQLQAAQVHARSGRLPEAQEMFEQVLRSRPDDVRALCGLAEIEGRLGRPAEGVGLLRRAIAVDERQIQLHVLLCQQLLRVGEFEEAVRSARRAVQLDPNSEAAHRMLADCHYRMHRLDEAIVETTKALAIDPGSVNAGFFLAVLQRQKGDLSAARSRLEGLIAGGLEPDLQIRVLTELGFVLDKLGAHDAAFESFERSAAVSAESSEARAIDRDQPMNLVDGYRNVTTRELLSRWARDSFADTLPRPTFLVGFPRSGTTLTEQVMAAHPDVPPTRRC